MLELKSRAIFISEELSIIGDPHLGRKFISNVPLHRRGEREAHQWETFKLSVEDGLKNSRLVWISGDLFHTADVDNALVINTALFLINQAEKYPHRKIVGNSGNHDLSKDVTKKSSFEALKMMTAGIENLTLSQAGLYFSILGPEKYLFVPYNPWSTPEKAIGSILEKGYDAIFGHWDIDGSIDTGNLIPWNAISKILKPGGTVYNGHIHLPEIRKFKDYTLNCVGSMLPYAHGEDPTGEFYIDCTLAEYNAAPESFKDKMIRISLLPGEILPENIDALQITPRFVDADMKEETQVQSGEFSFEGLFFHSFDTAGLSEEDAREYWEKYKERSNDTE